MKFSIVTPSYNMERWISETIESVLTQAGDFEIEYTIIDDGSQDTTVDIAQGYAARIANGSYPIKCSRIVMNVVTQENTGMYEAINRGFARSTGDIFAWINADDVYESGAFEAMATTFSRFPEIAWLKGITSTIDENSHRLIEGTAKLYFQDWIRDGVYGQEAYFIEQDSVFWRKSLWEKGGPMPSHMRSAADYWLWLSFAKHEALWTIDVPISCFRKREGQISKGIATYKAEQWQARPKRNPNAWRARLFFTPQSRLVHRFPFLEHFFISLFPLVFLDKKMPQYISLESGQPEKKPARSYIISPQSL